MTFIRRFLELLKLPENNNTSSSFTYEPNAILDTTDTSSMQQEVTKPKKSKVISGSDFDTFLWQCNSVSEEREKENTSDFQMQIDNPNDALETGYHNAMKDIAEEKKNL